MPGPTVDTPNGPFTLARGCDGCTLCCKVLAAEPIGKKMNQWCVHCIKGVGCGIHLTREPVCRNYHCGWLIDGSLGEEWRPETAHIIITYDMDGRRLNVHADEDYPDAWRSEPYYSQLKAWAAMALPRGGQVVGYVGKEVSVFLPDRHVDLGVLTDDDYLFIERLAGGGWDARKVNEDEAAKLQQSGAV